MSMDRNRGSYGLLSRYEWGFCAFLATLMVVGVTLEITRMTARSRKTQPSQPAVQEVSALRASTEAPAAANLSAR